MNSSTLKRSLAVIPVVLGFGSLFLAFSSCEKSVDPPLKNPREYTWTAETLAYPGSYQTTMRDIWASSPEDAWIVGHNDQNRGLMWHYDGKQWTDVKLSTTQGGNILGPIDLSAIYGFGANSIFAVGERIYQNPKPPPNFLDSSLIIHFDGQQWREQRIDGGRLLARIGGTSPSDLWTGGWTNEIHHYSNTKWERDSLPVIIPSNGFFSINSIVENRFGQVYAIGNTHQNSLAKTTHYFFQRSAGTWTLIDSNLVQPGFIENKWGTAGLWISNSQTLYSVGDGVFRWNGSSWIKLYTTQTSLTRIFGTSDENMFVAGDFGTVLHYNGTDWFEFKQFQDPNSVYGSVWTDGKEVFVVGFTATYPQKTIILRGK